MIISKLFKGYHDRRMARIFLIGIISGFPWVLIGSALTLWLKEDGLSRTTVGFAGLIFGVYAINFLWAPIIDKIKIPILSAKIGARKAWITLFQIIIMMATLGWSTLTPTADLTLVVALGLVIAIASASQDIALDAFRIEQTRPEENHSMTAGAAITVIGWWTGFKLGGFIMLFTADRLEMAGLANYWQMSFLVMACLIVMMNIGLVLIPETTQKTSRKSSIAQQVVSLLMAVARWLTDTSIDPLYAFFKNNGLKIGLAILGFILLFKIGGFIVIFVIACLMVIISIGLALIHKTTRKASRKSSIAQQAVSLFMAAARWLTNTAIDPLYAFFKNNGLKVGLAILGFIFLFKIGEAFMGKMSIVFYREIGFSKSEIGIYSKGLGWITTVGFTLIGGLIAMRFGTVKALLYAGIAMAGTNLMFTWLAWSGKSPQIFAAAVVMDDLAAAFANVAFVAFISLLVDRRYTATQYALLASIGTAGRTIFASSSGLLVDGLDGNWGLFFIITAVMVIPSLILLMGLGKYLKFRN
jgi:PAT family beta-lactamase induction signal transducer AmpG